jgi:hypothetical protein
MGNSKNTSSKKTGKSNTSGDNIQNSSASDCRSKSTSNKVPSAGNIRGV